MRVAFVGPVAHQTGYGQAANEYCRMLLREGVDLTIVPPTDISAEEVDGLDERFRPLLEHFGEIGNADLVISHAVPFGCAWLLEDLPIPSSAKRCALTTWESETLPQEAVEQLDENFDLTLWPSRYNVEIHKRQSKFPDKVKRLPHGFDPDLWPSGTRASLNDEYTFYSIMTFCERKNPIGLLKAYLTEFNPSDKVLLKILTPGYVEQEINDLVRGLKLKYYPPVEMICNRLSQKELLDLHLSSNSYVTCARSEGFGLGSFEASLVGNHVIATGYSGLLDFLQGRWNVDLLDYFLTPAYTPATQSNTDIIVAGLKIKPIEQRDHLGIFADQNWAEPNLHQMKQFMRRAYETRPPRTPVNRQFLEEHFSYKAVGKRMMGLFNELLNS